MGINFKTDNVPTQDTLVADLHNLVEVLLKLHPADKTQFIESLSILGKVPYNFEELGISADKYIKDIPYVYSTIAYEGVLLLDIFTMDPSELVILATLSEKDFQALVKDRYLTSFSMYTYASLFQLLTALVKMRLRGI
jgi:hypothetical protein